MNNMLRLFVTLVLFSIILFVSNQPACALTPGGFTAVGNLAQQRDFHTATLLPDDNELTAATNTLLKRRGRLSHPMV